LAALEPKRTARGRAMVCSTGLAPTS
jgi:hypothetical protein